MLTPDPWRHWHENCRPYMQGSSAHQQLGAIVASGSACAYFFKGSGYLRYNIQTDLVDVGPVAISRFWPSLPSQFHRDIGAVLNWGNGYVYFFKGAGYLRYNMATDMVDVGPVEISRFWRSLPTEFHTNIDAAVNWGNGYAFFFKGARCLRYEIATDLVEAGPFRRFLPGLPAGFESNLDAVVNWGDGKAYFFKGAGYCRYDMATDLVDVGPVEISRFWPALPPEFQRSIGAAVNWTHPGDLAGLMRAAGLTVNEVGNWRTRAQPGGFTPIGVMIHHTGGNATPANTLLDIVRGRKANLHIERNGTVNVVSQDRANHAGRGSGQVLDEVRRSVAPTGTAARRSLPDTVMGNGFFYGLENQNRGDGIQPWPEEQLDAMARATAALCQRHCWNANRVISHAEWTSRKIDPRGIDMNAFRARVTALF